MSGTPRERWLESEANKIRLDLTRGPWRLAHGPLEVVLDVAESEESIVFPNKATIGEAVVIPYTSFQKHFVSTTQILLTFVYRMSPSGVDHDTNAVANRVSALCLDPQGGGLHSEAGVAPPLKRRYVVSVRHVVHGSARAHTRDQ